MPHTHTDTHTHTHTHTHLSLLCADEDECEVGSPCSHSCNNIMGGFSCTCPTGFSISPKSHTCQGQTHTHTHTHRDTDPPHPHTHTHTHPHTETHTQTHTDRQREKGDYTLPYPCFIKRFLAGYSPLNELHVGAFSFGLSQ